MSPISIERSLHEVFAQISDPRYLRGTMSPLQAILTLVDTSMLGRDVESVIAQIAVPGQTNEPETVLELLKLILLEGTRTTGDAAFTQRHFG